LRVAVAQLDGSLKSVYDKGSNQELLWQGSADSWIYQDVVIFPLIGKPDGGYTVNGKLYNFEMTHGFPRQELFEVVEHTKTKLVLKLVANERTLVQYPYHFQLLLTYKLEGKKYKLTYTVSNTAGEIMPYQLGAHPGFNVTEGTNKIVFEVEEHLRNFPYDGKIQEKSIELMTTKELKVNEDIFDKHMSLVLDQLESKSCKLVRGDGITLKFDLGNSPRTTIWGFSKGGKFVCIEPWWGICESYTTPKEIFNKELISIIDGDEHSHFYSCELL
jgi:galactose mutarotase-like enzyme